MYRQWTTIAGATALFALMGCFQGPSESGGVTFEQVESLTESSDPELASQATGTVESPSGTNSDTTSASTVEVVVAEEPVTDSSSEIEGPLESVDTDTAQNAAAAITLTPEQEAQLAGMELTPEQRAALAGIQLQPDFLDKIFFNTNGALRVQFDDLDLEKVLNMTFIPPFATDYFPSWMNELDGKRVRIRGFMYTTFDGVTGFLLCRDLGPCCFGPNPRADYRIPVQLREGETTDYVHQIPFDVVGTFHVHLTIDDLGKVGHTYAITEATIIRL